MKKFVPCHSPATSLFLAVAILGLLAPMPAPAQDTNSAVTQRMFDSPDAATKALQEATKTGDQAALEEIFGPDKQDLLTGDKVQDKANFEHFSQAMQAGCVQEPEGDDRVVLGIGTNDWPFPIPLVKTNGQWFFDTDAGREEIIDRHIGRDELHAIGVCRAYVAAQIQYFSRDRDGTGVPKYALKFKSSPGKKDGLYWDSTDEPSPFSARVAEAHAEGYEHSPEGSRPHPFHGYFFKILTRQGSAAPGGRADYLVKGNLTGGFALVAYPVQWGKSGVMTFIVNHDGLVYERNFEEKTWDSATHMTRYNPDNKWSLVTEPGIPVSE
jgi:hypothetical protein